MGYKGVIPDAMLRRMPAAERAAMGKAWQTYEQGLAKLAAREEKELQRQVAALLRMHGIEANIARMDRRTTNVVGWPDATFAAHGKAVAFEMKRPGESLRPEQEQVRAKLVAEPNGWRYYVIHTVAEAVAALRELGVIK